MHPLKDLKVVCIGGGTGLSTLLTGFKQLVLASRAAGARGSLTLENLTAVVTVSDDGGSSGRIRDQFPTPAPGDIRNCLVALSSDESLMTELFRYRFRANGDLHDHSLGNLLLTALTDITGDFLRAVQLSSQVLAIEGQILPSTTENVRLRADLSDGSSIQGETTISRTLVPIQRIHLDPAGCKPLPATLEAISNADIITLGPGSLFTSLLPSLVVQKISSAIDRSGAFKIYIGNVMTQPGETRGFRLLDHVQALRRHTGEKNLFPFVLTNSTPVSPEMVERYRQEGAEPVLADTGPLRDIGLQVFSRPLLSEDSVVRHHPKKLARAVLTLFEEQRDEIKH